MADYATSYANTFITNLLNRTTDRTTPNNTSSAIRRISWAGDTLQDIETVNDGAHRCINCYHDLGLTVATGIPMSKASR